MRVDPRRDRITSRVIRPGQMEGPDRSWLQASIAERMNAVWVLTLASHEWASGSSNEPRLQRSITHIQRAGR